MAASAREDVEALNRTSDTVINLINDVLAHLKSLDEEPDEACNPHNAKIASISMAHDSAALIKAHATKISLLIINQPFTPTAITKVLKEVLEAPIPSLASAAAACEAVRYTSTFSRKLRFASRRVLQCLRELVQLIPRDGEVLSAEGENGSVHEKASTFITRGLWAACDYVTRLRTLGVRGLLVNDINQQQEMLDDMKEELKEWKEENEKTESDDEETHDDDDDDDPGFGSEWEDVDDAQTQLDNLMSVKRIPKGRTDIWSQLNPCITRLGLLSLLYKAMSKRRFKKLPNIPGEGAAVARVVERINKMYPVIQNLPEDFGELIGAFYELDAPLIESMRAHCFRQACAAAQLLRKPWAEEEEEDAFSDWIDKFEEQMKTPRKTGW